MPALQPVPPSGGLAYTGIAAQYCGSCEGRPFGTQLPIRDVRFYGEYWG